MAWWPAFRQEGVRTWFIDCLATVLNLGYTSLPPPQVCVCGGGGGGGEEFQRVQKHKCMDHNDNRVKLIIA